jgi:hypothetical protein
MTLAKHHNDAHHSYAPVAVPIYGIDDIDGENPLAEGFVGVSTVADTISPDPAQPYLEVVAPATLPEVSYNSTLIDRALFQGN